MLAATVVDWTRRQLDSENADWLRSLPYLRIERGITIVHATLDMPERWGYVFESLEAEPSFSYQNTQICFHGHTHVPVVFEKKGQADAVRMAPTTFQVPFGRKYFVNVGSVGQPRDGIPDASYVLYDLKTRTVEFRRLPYDIAETQALIRAAGLPERLAKRLEIGR